jgi:phosphonopyruvate decarboxylase
MVHILFDNGVHESTGGQGTVSSSIDFCRIAAACGYPHQLRVNSAAALGAALAASAGTGLTFIHAVVKPGVPDDLPRPKVSPEEVARRFSAFLQEPNP